MDLELRRKLLEPLGWHFDGNALMAPTKPYWNSASPFEAAVATYLPFARRRESAVRMGFDGVGEYDQILRALEVESSVATLVSRVNSVRALAAPWAAVHKVAITVWEFSWPSVRLTARHPHGGIACIDCEVEDNGEFKAYALHWCDDYTEQCRRVWKQALPPSDITQSSLIARLNEAHRILLEPRDFETFTTTTFASRMELTPDALASESGLEILC